MNRRIGLIFFVMAAGLASILAFSRSFSLASATASQEPQSPTALDEVKLNGPYDGVAGIEYVFTAVVTPTSAAIPITYVWQAAGETVTHTGDISDTFAVAWEELGSQPVTVTATNAEGTTGQVRSLNILPNPERIPILYGGPHGIYPGHSRAIIKTDDPSVFGQNICTGYGDPFSPLSSPWQPGPFTYQTVIQIPGDYPYDEVRIELFDPDSINSPLNDFTVSRTNIAIDKGLSPAVSLSCQGADANQKNPCQIDTGELDLVLSDTLDYEQINPLWFGRIDENRGAGAAPGNGGCGEPANYNAFFNTRTLYTLSYFWQNADGTTQKFFLASYTGQVGDGSRDTGNHQTDMHWVSPGAPPSYDQPANVPTDPGSATSFQIDLTSDVPNIIVDQRTGVRYLNLEITALDGSSENVFDIWAGPPIYTNTVPGEVNARNLHLLNNPAAHNAYGVTVYAINNLVKSWNLSGRTAVFPFTYFGPEAAGQDVFISHFDSDSGAAPPITFFADSIPRSEWSLSFAVPGEPDPDGETRNCEPGSCNNLWVDPPYRLTLPQNFPGGRLLVEYNGGNHDTAAWEITGAGQLFVDGPEVGLTNEPYSFTADAIYFLGTDIVTYTWEIEGQEPITIVNGLTSTVEVGWPLTGTKKMTVAATAVIPNSFFNTQETVFGHHQIMIGEPPVSPTAVSITGPLSGSVNMTYTFTAAISPTNTTQPITYVWEVAGQTTVTHTGGITDTLLMSWAATGSYDLTVTAVNVNNEPVTDTHSILIGLDERRLYLPLIFR